MVSRGRHLRHAARRTHPNGAFNVTEFGTVKDQPVQGALRLFAAHHVPGRHNYPAVLMLPGATDGRVNPMIAQDGGAAAGGDPAGPPILLRVASDAGHGFGTALASVIDQDADVFTFLFAQLGMR